MKKTRLWLVLPIIALLSACGLSPIEEKKGIEADEPVNILEESSLFIEDSEYPSRYLFETNDSKYLNEKGFTIWTTTKTNTSNGFESISVEMAKLSGRAETGFGVVFCEQQFEEKPYMLTVMINANGLYTIGKVVNGVFYHLEGNWKFSDYINKGYGLKNTICISYNNLLESFVLKINDEEITTFTVPEKIKFKGSESGYVVVISNREEFPEKAVRVEFEDKN